MLLNFPATGQMNCTAIEKCAYLPFQFYWCTLISLINVEVGINMEGGAKVAKSLNVEVGIIVEGGIFWKKTTT